MRDRCQVCGRVKALMKDGAIVRHYFRGDLCLGTYNKPYSQSGDALQEALEFWRRQRQRLDRRYLKHKDDRINEPLPAYFWEACLKASREERRLTLRIQRRNKLLGAG